jgi:hypothetical protein
MPSDYAIERLPGAVAAGEWDSSPNILDCNNPGKTYCYEIDFNMSSVNIECRWLVSYDRETAEILGYRTLNEAASNLFMSVTSGMNTQMNGTLFEDDGSTGGDATILIKRDYSPKHPDLYSGIEAGWMAVKRVTLNNGDDVIAVDFRESKADAPSEWIVVLTPGIHNRYKLLRTNSEASADFVRTGSDLQ